MQLAYSFPFFHYFSFSQFDFQWLLLRYCWVNCIFFSILCFEMITQDDRFSFQRSNVPLSTKMTLYHWEMIKSTHNMGLPGFCIHSNQFQRMILWLLKKEFSWSILKGPPFTYFLLFCQLTSARYRFISWSRVSSHSESQSEILTKWFFSSFSTVILLKRTLLHRWVAQTRRQSKDFSAVWRIDWKSLSRVPSQQAQSPAKRIYFPQ